MNIYLLIYYKKIYYDRKYLYETNADYRTKTGKILLRKYPHSLDEIYPENIDRKRKDVISGNASNLIVGINNDPAYFNIINYNLYSESTQQPLKSRVRLQPTEGYSISRFDFDSDAKFFKLFREVEYLKFESDEEAILYCNLAENPLI